MPLSGNTNSISLVSLLQIIETEKKTGRLILRTGNTSRQIFIHAGQIFFMTSEDPRDFLGHFLVSKGILSETILAEALKLRAENHEMLGVILTQMNVISEDKIKKQLVEKLKDSFFQTFLLKQVEFELNEDPIDLQQFPSVARLSIQPLLVQGLQRLDEYNKFKEVLAEPQQTFSVNRDHFNAELHRSKNTEKILGLLEKGMSIEALCMHFHTYEYNILKYLWPLHQCKAIEKLPLAANQTPAAVGVTSDPTPFEKMCELANNEYVEGNYVKAAEIFGDIVKIEPQNEYARSCLNEIEEADKKRISEYELPLHSVPILVNNIDLSKLTLTASEGFILSRMDGQMDVAQILSIVPIPEAEVTHTVKKLLDQGIIQFK